MYRPCVGRNACVGALARERRVEGRVRPRFAVVICGWRGAMSLNNVQQHTSPPFALK